MNHAFYLLILSLGIISCTTVQPPNLPITSDLTRHELPVRINERFILSSIEGDREYMSNPPLKITYFLDGKRQHFSMSREGDSNGYITYLGLRGYGKYPDREGPIITEQAIRLSTGETIALQGNTTSQGKVMLHSN